MKGTAIALVKEELMALWPRENSQCQSMRKGVDPEKDVKRIESSRGCCLTEQDFMKERSKN